MPVFLPSIFCTITAITNGLASVSTLPDEKAWRWTICSSSADARKKADESGGKAPGLFDKLNPNELFEQGLLWRKVRPCEAARANHRSRPLQSMRAARSRACEPPAPPLPPSRTDHPLRATLPRPDRRLLTTLPEIAISPRNLPLCRSSCSRTF